MSVVGSMRCRRRIRCWLGLPVRSLLDPVVRSSLRSMESVLWSEERGVWLCPAWGLSSEGGLSERFVSSVCGSGLWRSSWWGSVRPDITGACGSWAGVSVERPVVEEVSLEELSEVSSEELEELSEVSSVLEREVWVVRSERRRGRL